MLSVTRGKAASFDLVCLDAAGAPADLTLPTLWFTAKSDLSLEDAAAEIHKKTGGFGIVVVNALGGLARVDLDPADTLNLPLPLARTLFWDLQTYGVDLKPRILARGTLVVIAAVTRASAP